MAKTINLNTLTALERQFVEAAVKEWNDLMFTDDINHGIAKASLGGVCSSLVKKNIIDVYSSPGLTLSAQERNIGEFQFIGEDGYTNFDEPPVLVEE